MLIPEQFAGEMLLTSTTPAMTESVNKAIDQLWIYEYELFRFATVINVPVITLPPNVVEVVGCSYNRVLLTRADESILDATQPTWRAAASATPRSYLFRGEVPNGQLRLHPAPDAVLPVHVMCSIRPALDQLVHWQRLFVTLRAVELLSISDPIRTRPPVAQFMQPLIQLITQDLRT